MVGFPCQSDEKVLYLNRSQVKCIREVKVIHTTLRMLRLPLGLLGSEGLQSCFGVPSAGWRNLLELMSSLLSEVSSAPSQQPSPAAANAAEPFAAREELSEMMMLLDAAKQLCDSLGRCILGCLCPTSPRLLDQSWVLRERGLASGTIITC